MAKTVDRILKKLEDWADSEGPDCFGQFCFLFGLVFIAGFGVREAIPGLYGEESAVGEYFRWFGGFLFVEVLINWICIKCVGSSYEPGKHGTQPENMAQYEVDCRKEGGDVHRPFYDNIRHINNEDISRSETTLTTMRKDATSVPLEPNYEQIDNENIETKPHYFSWQYCHKCNRPCPPRAHHCVVCEKCVLKRDHHCFVTGVCIGHNNLRHFTVMLFWSVIATTFAGLHSLAYFWYFILPYTSIFDLFLPLAMLRCVVFRVQVKHLLLILIGWLLAGFFIWSIGFFRRVCKCLATGLTSYEQVKDIQLYDSKSFSDKLKSVFGKAWILNFIVPLHFIFQPIEDPVNWPSISQSHVS